MINIPILLTLYAGFTHAFETDHLLAVSSMVTNRNRTIKAIKDGMYWGLGHTSTILAIGIIVLLLKFQIEQPNFKYFEAMVGIMLVGLGLYRIYQWYKKQKTIVHANHQHNHDHVHTITKHTHEHSHLSAYLIGTVHGLAGSGALILIVMGKSESITTGLFYLLLFGVGSIGGMMLAAGVFSLPFSKKIIKSTLLQTALIFISALLCIGYGLYVITQNLL